jgi:tetratricopeptide (TPR) repeat protein
LKVVFYGGRQALRLALVYVREADDPQGANWMADHLAPSADDAETLRGADKIVWIDSGAPPLDVEDLELSAEIVRLPELQLDFLWPFGGQPHIANFSDALYPDGPFPAELGDAWLNRALEGPARAEAAEEAYLALDVARAVDLDRMRDLSLARQAERDRLYGVDFASRIEAGFRAPSLFLSPRTPGRELFGALAQTAFARLGLTYSGAAEAAPAARELPIHPRVAEHFGLEGASGRVCVDYWGGPVDFTEYVRRYLAFAEGPELEHGLAMLAAGRAEEAVDRLEIAAARPMGRRSSSALRGLAHASVLALNDPGRRADLSAFVGADVDDPDILAVLTAFARGRPLVAERRLMAYLAHAPDRAENFAVLATIRETRGDVGGALAALEGAVGLGTRDPRLMGRFAMALAARGDMMATVRAVEAQIALDPQNPHAHAFHAQFLVHVGWRGRAEEALERALAVVGDAPELASLRAMLNERRAALAR